MDEVVSISEAKTNLSKLVKRAGAGETIYIGAYGNVQAVLGPAPRKLPVSIGIWAHLSDPDFDYGSDELIGPDSEVAAEFEKSVGRDGLISQPE